MQKHSYNLAKTLAKYGIYVDLYHCVEHDKPLVDNLNCFSKEELKFINNICLHFDKPGKYPGHYITRSYNYSKKFINLSLRKKCGLCLCSGSYWMVLCFKKKNYNLPPIAVNFHGLEMYQKAASFNEKLKQVILKPPLKYISQLTNINYSLGGKLSSILKLLAPNQNVIERPNAISKDWLFDTDITKENKVRKFVFLGRYVRHKGVQELNNILKRICNL